MTRPDARGSRGIAAVETALVLAVCATILVGCLYYGRLALRSALLDRAASDAARYLATVQIENLRDSGRRATVLATAQAMMDEALAGAGVEVLALQVEFRCGVASCAMVTASSQLPSVGVAAVLQYHDDLFGSNAPLELSAYAEVGRGN